MQGEPARTRDGLEDLLEHEAHLDRVLRALAHPVRRFLLEMLVDVDASAGDLAASAAVNFGISSARGSQHLQVLAEAELVTVIPDGPWRYYRLAPNGSDVAVAWLAGLADPAIGCGRAAGRD